MKINGKQYQSVWMREGKVYMIDQRILPHDFKVLECASVEGVCEAIRNMTVRGAPAIGAAGICGMALAELTGEDMKSSYERLIKTRPTAYDLKDALDNYKSSKGAPMEKAQRYLTASSERCRMIGVHGAKLLKNGMNVLTHCNAGALACVDWGTALAPMRVAKEKGVAVHVWVDETRPRCQGAKITAWELMQEGIPHTLIADNAAGHLMQRGMVDTAIVGADRIAVNGDAANKIGTYEKAVVARENGIPFYVAAPTSTFDRKCRSGGDIPIEERDGNEVAKVYGKLSDGTFGAVDITYEGCPVANPAFDVTPAKYISGYITENGVFDSPKFL